MLERRQRRYMLRRVSHAVQFAQMFGIERNWLFWERGCRLVWDNLRTLLTLQLRIHAMHFADHLFETIVRIVVRLGGLCRSGRIKFIVGGGNGGWLTE